MWAPSTNLRLNVSPLPALPSCRGKGFGHRPQVPLLGLTGRSTDLGADLSLIVILLPACPVNSIQIEIIRVCICRHSEYEYDNDDST